MSKLYARVFAKILESSIADDWQVRMVFQDFLLLAEDGTVDMTHQAIARRTNVPLEIVERAITVLEEPDPRSRDRENDGRRIVRLDPHRDWGWQITNFEKYESIRCQNETREVRAARMRHYREKKAAAHPNPPPPPAPPLKDEDKDIDIDIGGGPTHSTTRSTTDGAQVALPNLAPLVTGAQSPPPSKTRNGWHPSPLQLRIGRLFRRRDATKWSVKEEKAFLDLGPLDESDIRAVEAYYGETIPQDKDYRRRDLLTLLNNWPGEVDRARQRPGNRTAEDKEAAAAREIELLDRAAEALRYGKE